MISGQFDFEDEGFGALFPFITTGGLRKTSGSLGFLMASKYETRPATCSLSRFVVGHVASYRSAVLEVFR